MTFGFLSNTYTFYTIPPFLACSLEPSADLITVPISTKQFLELIRIYLIYIFPLTNKNLNGNGENPILFLCWKNKRNQKGQASITTSTFVFIWISSSSQAHRKNTFSYAWNHKSCLQHQELFMHPGWLDVWSFLHFLDLYFFTHKRLNSFPKAKN